MMSDEIRARVAALGPWFHNIRIGGVETAPSHPLGDYPTFKWRKFRPAVEHLVAGRSVLDIGCNGGFYAIEMARLGASRVLGIDEDEDYLAQARFAAEAAGAGNIELRRLSVYDIAALGERFDIVLFMGVLYHLRHPLLALDLIHEHAARDMLVFQSMIRGSPDVLEVASDYAFDDDRHLDHPGHPKLHFVEHSFAGDCTNWWIPNRACVEAMLRSSGFAIATRPEAEVYVCHRVDRKGAAP